MDRRVIIGCAFAIGISVLIFALTIIILPSPNPHKVVLWADGGTVSYADKRENVTTVYSFSWLYYPPQQNQISVGTKSYVNNSAFPENQNYFFFPVTLNAVYNVGSKSSIYGEIQFNITGVNTGDGGEVPAQVTLSVQPLS
jgi:hypothetical protein